MSCDTAYILCHCCIIGQKRLRGAKLRYKTITLGNSRRYSKVKTARFIEEQSVDCPDCSDMMLMVYNWDKFSYLCENCGLTVANPDSLSTHDIEAVG